MSLRAPLSQASTVFASVFVVVWVGTAIVTINAKLLGGAMYVRSHARAYTLAPPIPMQPLPHSPSLHRPLHACVCMRLCVQVCSSFFQSMCVLGYCLCPLVVAACLCALLRFTMLQTLLVGGALVWSMKGTCITARAPMPRLCTACLSHAAPPAPCRVQLPWCSLVSACRPRAPCSRSTPSSCFTPPLAGWCTFSSLDGRAVAVHGARYAVRATRCAAAIGA
ncbi:hypothetical protein EON67_09005 [archaeon]|nr:MAG: hypothetical protein EON67_09005 [archaeon]